MRTTRPRLQLSVLWPLFLVGCLLLYGLIQLAESSDQPTCDGRVMSPGEVCDVYVNGIRDHTDTYEDRVQQAKAAAKPRPLLMVLAGVGVLLFLGGGIWMMVSHQRKAAAYDAAELAEALRRQSRYS